MTVSEIESRMDSRELSEWIAYDRYYEPIGEEWLRNGYLCAAILAPHSKSRPKPADFVPIQKAPMAPSQINEQLQAMIDDLNGDS